MTFTKWISFEADRIVSMGQRVTPEHQADYMRVQIVAALRKALAHGRDGFRTTISLARFQTHPLKAVAVAGAGRRRLGRGFGRRLLP